MYAREFGFSRRPFPATPDRVCYYPATSHEAALAGLVRAVADDEGFASLTGAPGTGKTLACHCLMERLGGNTIAAFLTNSHLPDRLSLLQAILHDLSLAYEGSEQVLRLRLTDFLLANCAAGKRTLAIIDEAQHLAPDLVEELRLLGNLEAEGGKAFQVILVGQGELLETLARPELAACNQRLTVRTRLEPLELEESVDYLLHQLRLAGGKPEAIFDEPALEILARGAGGVPRILNQVGHQALSLAHQAEMNRVDAEAALEALAVLGLESSGAKSDAPDETAQEDTPQLDLVGSEPPLRRPGEDDGSVRLFGTPRPA